MDDGGDPPTEYRVGPAPWERQEDMYAPYPNAGEFYTPPEVSLLIARLVDPQPGERICDPACGSGSLLIRYMEQVGNNDYSIWGQRATARPGCWR